VYVLVWLFEHLDAILGQWLPPEVRFPGVGLLALVLILLFTGWMLRWAIGRRALSWWNRVLLRLPLTRRIYNASSQIVQTLLDRDDRIFRSVALIEYPSPGSYAVVLVTAAAPATIAEARPDEELVSVFLPTTPNPTTGYLLVVPADRIRVLDMSVEDAMKFIISAGVVSPEADRPALGGLDVDRLLREARRRRP
ncbi:MAG TPA: DUF502 domain-containing protein, partial [Gemmatimonadota bacterium]|nr:DUF502 domain-containing protein [Gemmatimonadota bacterium]